MAVASILATYTVGKAVRGGVSITPEPGTYVLVAAGLLVAVVYRRRWLAN